MIEIISNEISGKGNEKQPKQPKNVKQIGEIEGNCKIYLEDYVNTYIMNIAKKKSSERYIGILLGETKEYEGIRYNFIDAAMEIENREELNSNIWNDIYDNKKEHFPQKEIVGWFLIDDEVSKNQMLDIERMHLNNFAGGGKCLFLVERNYMEGSFYIYENRCLKKNSGYNIYYEKNELMQDYMIGSNVGKKVDEDLNDRAITSFRQIINERNEKAAKNGYMGLVSSFLAVVIIVIGINMINSYEKLKNLDYMMNNISNKVTDISNNELTPVVNLPGLVEPKTNEIPTQEQTEAPSETSTEEPTQEPTEKTTEAPTEAQTQKPTQAIKEDEKIPEFHIVKEGESIYTISRKYYGSTKYVKEILKYNNIENANKIYPEQKIKLP